MTIPFVTRNATNSELRLFQLAMSSFCDGSGQEKEGNNGRTRPGWCDFERIVASILGGQAHESKNIFDVIIASTKNQTVDYGISIKSKKLSNKKFKGLDVDQRVHMELSNSPAKFWDALELKGIGESDFRNSNYSSEIGNTLIETVTSWHNEAMLKHQSLDRKLDLRSSVFLVISYNEPTQTNPKRQYQIHSFNLDFPSEIYWEYSSPKCLRGYDSAHSGETLFDWYGVSGGQLKYYPRGSTSKYSSPPFELILPQIISIEEKTAKYWPQEWLDAGGTFYLTNPQVADEIERLSILLKNKIAQKQLQSLIFQLRQTS